MGLRCPKKLRIIFFLPATIYHDVTCSVFAPLTGWKQYPFLPFAITHNSRLGGLLSMTRGRRERKMYKHTNERDTCIFIAGEYREL